MKHNKEACQIKGCPYCDTIAHNILEQIMETKINMTTKTNNEWEKEFDRKFPGIEKLTNDEHPLYKRGPMEDIKSFVNSLLSTERQRLREEIEGMKKGGNTAGWCNDCNGHTANEHHQMTCENYNQALSDILKLLE